MREESLEEITPRQHLVNLIQLVARQDKRAFEELYRHTSRRMYAVALRIVREPSMAQDVLQDAYIRLWRYAHTFNEKLSSPETWLHQVVRNRALDLISQASNHTSSISIDRFSDEDEELNDDNHPSMEMETPEQMTIRGCLGQLDGKYRQVLTLAFSHGMSHAEISDHLAIPLGTVKTWARRGLIELKTAYEQAGMDVERNGYSLDTKKGQTSAQAGTSKHNKATVAPAQPHTWL